VQIIFSRCSKAHFFQRGVFRKVEETHISFEGKPSFLDAGVTSTLFPCEN
jgi:hypothetical protein